MPQEKSVTDILTNFNTNISPTERLVSGVVGGALVAYGAKRRDAVGVVLSIIGGGLTLRGATGHCQVYDAMDINTADEAQIKRLSAGSKRSPFSDSKLGGKVHVKKSVTINKSPAEIYQFWRNFENLPKFMAHLESVTVTGEKTSFWKAKAPLGQTVEWAAEITSDVENERIGWQSAQDADIPNSGVVEFNPTANRGTEVRVVLTYEAPGGQIGAAVAKLFGEEPSQQVYGDLCRLKSIMETGLIMSVEGQPSGREKDQAKTANA